MNLGDTLEVLQRVVTENRELIKNEESTKQFLVLPFLKGLGYDTYSPKEVTPEFTADFHKKNEKVDYAISLEGEPKIFLEAKSIHSTIQKNAPQLSRYFSTFPSVHLGILTNGIEYHFFTDLNNANIMDTTPFFVFNIIKFTKEDFHTLIKFSKNLYDDNEIKLIAESLMYSQSFKSVIEEILEKPSDAFIKFVIKERFKIKVTQTFIQSSRPLIEKCLQETINDIINQKLDYISNHRKLEESTPTTTKPEKKSYYSLEEIESLGTFEVFENIKVVLPNIESYKSFFKVPISDYSLQKGNPLSDFFVSSVIIQGSSIVGYLIGQYSNNHQDTTLYTVKANEIEKFITENPVLSKVGFINARLSTRISKETKEKTYYLKSSLPNLSFRDVPNLVSKVENVDVFFSKLK